jgi:hypothetical protein
MHLRNYKLFMLVVLLLLAMTQGAYLFYQWTNIPRADISHWRVEYASLNFDEDVIHRLQIQLRCESSTVFKKSSVPHIEVVLTNIGGEPLAYRHFTPQEWLSSELPRKNEWLTYGVASQTEITIAIPIEVPKDASGYQVHLLY